ncbi:von Willebrand factor, type A [Seminavis robusta]|uniref:von Willebrand factor, type A n=1 Tax=Seminavis robusta TaxID=568900 RepID=A0A9N8DUW0_9STRA|nr:von Willebrand factor, type A [Seminavis robusta]|eukprot:Sro360_g126210.1 von Willebrand factor, type A (1488) ;mRNA; f:13709-18832
MRTRLIFLGLAVLTAVEAGSEYDYQPRLRSGMIISTQDRQLAETAGNSSGSSATSGNSTDTAANATEVAAQAGTNGTQVAAQASANGTEVAAEASANGTQVAAGAGANGTEVAAQAGVNGTEVAAQAGANGTQVAAGAGANGTEVAAQAGVNGTEVAAQASANGTQVAAGAGANGTEVAAQAGVNGTEVAAEASANGTQVAAGAGANGTEVATQAGVNGTEVAAEASANGTQVAAQANASGTIPAVVVAANTSAVPPATEEKEEDSGGGGGILGAIASVLGFGDDETPAPAPVEEVPEEDDGGGLLGAVEGLFGMEVNEPTPPVTLPPVTLPLAGAVGASDSGLPPGLNADLLAQAGQAASNGTISDQAVEGLQNWLGFDVDGEIGNGTNKGHVVNGDSKNSETPPSNSSSKTPAPEEIDVDAGDDAEEDAEEDVGNFTGCANCPTLSPLDTILDGFKGLFGMRDTQDPSVADPGDAEKSGNETEVEEAVSGNETNTTGGEEAPETVDADEDAQETELKDGEGSQPPAGGGSVQEVTLPPAAEPQTKSPTAAPVTLPPVTLAPTPCDICKEPPKISDVPDDKTICPHDYILPKSNVITAKDACDNDVSNSTSTTVKQAEELVNNNTCVGQIVNIWTVDIPSCNASAPVTAKQTLKIEDLDPPQFSDAVLPDLVYTCPSDYNESLLQHPFATDNCDSLVSVIPQTGYLEGCQDLDVLWVATDECGNEATMSQTVKIDDAMAPILMSTAPHDEILSCADSIPPMKMLMFIDNCAGEFEVNGTDDSTGGGYCDGDVTVRTWDGPSDVCGNQADSVTQRFTVLDQSAPILDSSSMEKVALKCPNHFNVNDLTVPNATDDCSAADDITVIPQAPNVVGCEDLVVMWEAKDECGNTYVANQIIEFTDSTSPMPFNGTAPPDVTLHCKDPFPASENLVFVDNCDDDVDVTSVDEDIGGSFCDGKVTIRKWQGPTDTCGNSASEVTQMITVVDQEAPTLPEHVEEALYTCPSDFQLSNLKSPDASDDCDQSVTVTSTFTPSEDTCGNITVKWTATDVCNQKSSVNQTVFFGDNEGPVLQGNAPVDVTLKCKDEHPDASTLTFKDNCGEEFHVEAVEMAPTGSVCEERILERYWLGPTDECHNSALNYSQTIIIKDSEAPALPKSLSDLSYTCPQDFKLEEVDKPSATDDCSIAVNVNGTVPSPVEACAATSILWTATDDCNKTASINQKVVFTDTIAPTVVGASPTDITVGCGQFPKEEKLVFWDYCAGDLEVFSKDSLPSGNVCQGQTFVRTWEGPSDTCGNTASAVTQSIVVMDLGAPSLPESLPDVILFCPIDFNEHELVAPNATDDCDKSVVVEREVPVFLDKCAEQFDIVWTAVDECSKTDVVTQKVRFEGTQKPSITCPTVIGDYTGGGGTFSHGVDYGDCYTADDVTITYEASCSDCNGDSCAIEMSSNGADLTISGAPDISSLVWTAKLDYGCGVVDVTCTVGDCPA